MNYTQEHHEVARYIEDNSSKLRDLEEAEYLFSQMKENIENRSFLNSDFMKENLGKAQEFLFACQSSGLSDKLSGEFKNYILGEYRSNKDPIGQAITESETIPEKIDSLKKGLTYDQMICLAVAQRDDLTVTDKVIDTNVKKTYKEIVDFYNDFVKHPFIRKHNMKHMDGFLYPEFTRRDENGARLLSFGVSTNRLKEFNISEEKVFRVISEVEKDIDKAQLKMEDASYDRMSIDFNGFHRDSIVPDGAYDNLSNSKKKKVDKKFGRAKPKATEPSIN